MSKKLSLLFVLVIANFTIGEVIPTNEWVSFYSLNSTLNGEPIPAGTVIDAYDPDSVHCGTFTVTVPGAYGIMPVYRDDATTPDVDEGADPGDTITFKINNVPVPETGTWTFNGDVIELDLHAFVPCIDINPSFLDFGQVIVNDSSSINLTIRNVGGADLSVSNIDWVAGGGIIARQSVFLLSDTSGIIFPGDSLVISVGFFPILGYGVINDTLIIISNDPDTPSISLSVTGDIITDVIFTNEWVSFWSMNSIFDSLALQIGDVVDAYDPDKIHCGAWVVTTEGAYGAMAVYRDDATTPGVDEGAEPGDEINFRINGCEAKPLGPDENVWTANGDIWQVDLENIRTKTVEIYLNSGWNLVSWNVDTENDSIRVLLEDILDCIIVVLGFDGAGYTFDPDLPDFINTLDSLDHMHGYWIKTDCEDTLIVYGSSVDSQTPYYLDNGWNLISYLPDECDSTRHALSTILDNIIVVLGFDGAGFTFDPDLPDFINTLDFLCPKFGYWVKTEAVDTLIYPETPVEISGYALAKKSNKSAICDLIPTNEWISIYGTEIKINNALISTGTIVQAFDPDKVCCGEFIVEEAGVIGLMPVYRDDPTTPDIDEGANSGDSITIFINDYEIPNKIVWTFNGDIINISTIITSSSENLKVLPNIYKLCQNFPNPFNPVTTINYQIPEASNIELKIYNARGQEIKTLVSKYQQAGYYQVRWYGADSKGSQVSTGVYIYKITAGNFSKTMKMAMIK